MANIWAHAGAPEVTTEMRSRIAGYWRCVHPELGAQAGKELDGG